MWNDGQSFLSWRLRGVPTVETTVGMDPGTDGTFDGHPNRPAPPAGVGVRRERGRTGYPTHSVLPECRRTVRGGGWRSDTGDGTQSSGSTPESISHCAGPDRGGGGTEGSCPGYPRTLSGLPSRAGVCPSPRSSSFGDVLGGHGTSSTESSPSTTSFPSTNPVSL